PPAAPAPAPRRGGEKFIKGGGRPPPAAAAADRTAPRRNPRLPEKKPCRQRVVECRRERMLRRQTVSDRQRAHFCGAACLRYHSPVAADRTRAVSTAMEKQQNARGVAAYNIRPFA